VGRKGAIGYTGGKKKNRYVTKNKGQARRKLETGGVWGDVKTVWQQRLNAEICNWKVGETFRSQDAWFLKLSRWSRGGIGWS